MNLVQWQTVSNGADLHLDGKHFKGCTYTGAKLIYSGGELPVFEQTAFSGCQAEITGPPEKIEAVKRLLTPLGFSF